MTVNELIERLKTLPGDSEIFIASPPSAAKLEALEYYSSDNQTWLYMEDL